MSSTHMEKLSYYPWEVEEQLESPLSFQEQEQHIFQVECLEVVECSKVCNLQEAS
jgi:hypothetical protein